MLRNESIVYLGTVSAEVSRQIDLGTLNLSTSIAAHCSISSTINEELSALIIGLCVLPAIWATVMANQVWSSSEVVEHQ